MDRTLILHGGIYRITAHQQIEVLKHIKSRTTKMSIMLCASSFQLKFYVYSRNRMCDCSERLN